MAWRRIWAGCLGLVAAALPPAAGTFAQEAPGGAFAAAASLRTSLFHRRPTAGQEAAARVPLPELPADVRDRVQRVLERPTLFTQAPAEVFTCCPALYHWFLEHPDQAVRAWRRLGAKCMEIQNRGSGVFAYADEQGSDVRWWTIYRGPGLRIWYAEGQGRAASAVPLIPVQAVVVLHHEVGRSPAGRTVVRHQADLFVHTDSRAAALIARIMGAAAPRMAEECAGQVEMFFSALVWYLDQHPERAATVLAGVLPEGAPEWRELRRRADSPRTEGSVPPATLGRLHG